MPGRFDVRLNDMAFAMCPLKAARFNITGRPPSSGILLQPEAFEIYHNR